MRLIAATALALVALPTVASAARPAPGPPHLVVTGREVLTSAPTSCPGFRTGAEASPTAVADGRDVTAVWQQDVDHDAAGSITTIAATLSTRVGGPCSATTGGPRANVVGPPSTARGADGRVWTAVAESGSEVNRVLLSDGERTVVVEEQPATPVGNLELLPATVAVDPRSPRRVHVAYSMNVFPAGTVSVHREVDAVTGAVSAAHPYWYGPTPALYDFREQLVALGGDALLALSTEVDPAGLPGLAPSYVERTDLTQAPVVVRARRSTDAGMTWSLPQTVLRLSNGAVRDPQGGTALRSLVHPSVAVGPDGRVHVAAESVEASGTDLLVASTDDAGLTWSQAPAVRRPGVAIATAVAVDGRGRTALSWLDVDGDLHGTWRAQLVAAQGRAVDLSSHFDLRRVAPAYVGDQGSLVGLDRGFAAVTVVGTGVDSNPTDVVLVRLR